MTITQEDLDAIWERERKASEGPWENEEGWATVHQSYDAFGLGRIMGIADCRRTDSKGRISAQELREANAEFIAHARTDIPVLKEHIEDQAKALSCSECGEPVITYPRFLDPNCDLLHEKCIVITRLNGEGGE